MTHLICEYCLYPECRFKIHNNRQVKKVGLDRRPILVLQSSASKGIYNPHALSYLISSIQQHSPQKNTIHSVLIIPDESIMINFLQNVTWRLKFKDGKSWYLEWIQSDVVSCLPIKSKGEYATYKIITITIDEIDAFIKFSDNLKDLKQVILWENMDSMDESKKLYSKFKKLNNKSIKQYVFLRNVKDQESLLGYHDDMESNAEVKRGLVPQNYLNEPFVIKPSYDHILYLFHHDQIIIFVIDIYSDQDNNGVTSSDNLLSQSTPSTINHDSLSPQTNTSPTLSQNHNENTRRHKRRKRSKKGAYRQRSKDNSNMPPTISDNHNVKRPSSIHKNTSLSPLAISHNHNINTSTKRRSSTTDTSNTPSPPSSAKPSKLRKIRKKKKSYDKSPSSTKDKVSEKEVDDVSGNDEELPEIPDVANQDDEKIMELQTRNGVDDDNNNNKIDICPVCDNGYDPVNGDYMVQCDGECKTWHHIGCVGVDTNRFKVLNDNEESKWFCSRCKGGIGNEMDIDDRESDEEDEEDGGPIFKYDIKGRLHKFNNDPKYQNMAKEAFIKTINARMDPSKYAVTMEVANPNSKINKSKANQYLVSPILFLMLI